MTTPTDTFDPRTAKQLAAKIVDEELCGYDADEMCPLDELHTKCFDALGKTPDEIAAKLAEYGILGTRPDRVEDDGEVYGDMVDDKGNALAVYFRDVCGAAASSFNTTDGLLYWDGTEEGSEIGHESVELPEQLVAFQRAYQDFEYEQLIDPNSTSDTNVIPADAPRAYL
jgi:hypothetical protein